MKAIILAAGRSSRLYPLTLEKPKCLLELDNELCMIDYQISVLRSCGIDDIVVVVGYKKEMIMEHLKDQSIQFIAYDDYAKYNNIHTFYHIRESLNDDAIILFSDVLFSKKLIQKLMDANDYSLLVHNQNVLEDTMRVVVNNGLIKEVGSHIPVEEGYGNFIGIAKYSKLALSRMTSLAADLVQDENYNQAYYTGTLNLISTEVKINAVLVNDEPWVEIDFLSDYEKAKTEIYPKLKEMINE